MKLKPKLTVRYLKTMWNQTGILPLVGGLLAFVMVGGCDREGITEDEDPCHETRIGLPYPDCPGYHRLLDTLNLTRLQVDLTPEWENAAIRPVNEVEKPPREIQFYLDLSHPIGGFVPLTDPNESHFPAMVDAVGRHLLAVFGEGGVPVRWYGFDDQVKALGQRPRITRSLFDGGNSDLTIALARAQADLVSGNTDAAVFLTDLMVTRGGFASPIHLPNYVANWVEASRVENGHFDIAIVGARLDYWGVHHRTCSNSGAIGCWYNERKLQYVELENVVESPVYLLILSKRAGGQAELVRDLTKRIYESLTDLAASREQGRIHYELLTEQTDFGHEVGIEIKPAADSNPTVQYNRAATNLTLWCVDNRPVSIAGEFQSGGAAISLQGVSVFSEGPEPLVEGNWADDQLNLEIECSRIRRPDSTITTGLTLSGQLDIAQWNSKKNEPWQSWQTTDYSPTGTVDLTDALDRLRIMPDLHTLDLRGLFTFPESKN